MIMGNKYWFRRRAGLKSRDLGYGYVPVSWEGWIIVLFFILVFAGLVFYFINYIGDSLDSGIWLTVSLAATIVAMVLVCEMKVKK